MQKTTSPSVGLRCVTAAMLLLLLGQTSVGGEDGWTPLGADDNFGVWHQPTGDWYVAGDAMVDPENSRRLVGKPGTGVLINGQIGKTDIPSVPGSHRRQTVERSAAHALASVATLNVPPEGFTALFNGKDLTGWHTPPLVKQYWSIEDGVLKSPALLEQWGACLATKKHYRDFVLMLDFRMPTISDSGINFRRLIPEVPGFGDQEQFNLRSRGGMGHLESYYFLPKETTEKMGLKEEEKPHLCHIDPEVGVWHTVKLTMQGRTFSAEYDGELIHDNFVYHDWMINMEPAPIRLQKHIVVRGDNLGDENPCPIEYRNVFIKELGPNDAVTPPSSSPGHGQRKPPRSPHADLLARIDAGELPEGYEPVKHQEYVDRRFPELSPEQAARVVQLWKEKQEIAPDMPNRGFSFVKILAYVAGEHAPLVAAPPAAAAHEHSASAMPIPHPVHHWKWSAETDKEDANRKAVPFKIPEGPTIYVLPFGVSEGDKPPVALLPESRLSVSGRVATAHPVHFGITINHPNGDFAGRFHTVRPADEFQSGKDFEVTVELRDFQLDPSLAGMKDKLPSEPFHFVVESVWFTTLEKEAGLEIAEVKLIPPSETTSSESNNGDDSGKSEKVNLPPLAKAEANNWPQFGGPDGNGVCNSAGPPRIWSERSNIVWSVRKSAPRTPSYLLVDGTVLWVTDDGIAVSVDAKSGEVIWRQRLGGNFSASLISAGGRVYFFNQDATATVIEPGREYKELATNHLDGEMHASPAVSGNSLFVRTKTHLYRIEQ